MDRVSGGLGTGDKLYGGRVGSRRYEGTDEILWILPWLLPVYKADAK